MKIYIFKNAVAKTNIYLYMYTYVHIVNFNTQSISTDLHLLDAGFCIRTKTNTFVHPKCHVLAQYYSKHFI